MRWRPLRWLIGLPLLIVLGAIAVFGELPSVQDDLRGRATDALQAAGFGWAKLDFDARDGHITGTANSEHDQQAALDTARTLWGVRIVGDETNLIQALKPYSWSITRDGRNVAIDGYADSDANRKGAGDAAAAQLRGLTVKQSLKLARGMPQREQWLAAIGFAATQMAGLSKGQARLTDLGLSISGAASTPESYEGLTKALSGGPYPAGLKITKVDITPPIAKPFAWDAAWKPGQLALSGYVPDEQVRGHIVQTANTLFPGATITDHLLLAAGPPDDFAKAALAALAPLSRLESGTVKFSDTKAELRGVAVEQDTAEAASGMFHSSLPSGFKTSETVTFHKARLPIIKPFVWSAQLAGKSLELSGFVPDEKSKGELAAFAGQHFAAVHVNDRTSIGQGAPSGFEQAAMASLDQLARLDQGSTKLSDTSVELTGHALEVSIADAALASLAAALPRGYQPSVSVQADKPKTAVIVPAKPPEPPKVVKPAEPVKPAEVAKAVEPPKLAQGPYVWDAVLANGSVTVSGGARGKEGGDLVLSLIGSRLPGVAVVNNQSVVDQIPSSEDDWLRSIDAGLKALSDLGGGHVHIQDRNLTVTGVTTDKAMPDYVTESLRRSVPAAYATAAQVDYTPPPAPPAYVTTLKYDGLRVVLEGLVPDAVSKSKLLARLKPLFPDRDFDDRTSVQTGAPDGWYDALSQGVGPLSNLDSGQLTLRDRNIFLSGTAEDEKILNDARQRVGSGLPKGYAGQELLTFVAPPAPDPKLLAKKQDESKYDVGKLMKQANGLSAPECQAVLNSVLRGKVFFASGRADLDPHSTQSLGAVLNIAKRCPATRVEISGHTDSDGAPAFNQRLSERRAQSVVKFLAGKGIGANRLSAVGYGPAQPIAPNDTVANKARNRRIEFVVTPG